MSFKSIRWQARVLLSRLGVWKYLEQIRLRSRLILEKPHEPEFQIFSKIGDTPGLFLDIGANIGQSAVSFRIFNKSYDILSLEPNPALAPDLAVLKKVLGPKFNFKSLGAGDEEQLLTLFVPTVDGLPLTQEGALEKSTFESDPLFKVRVKAGTGKLDYQVQEFKIKIVRIDDLNLAPDIIKIDVQGHELAALKGMMKTIADHLPLVMMENCENLNEISEFFLKLGYLNPFFYNGSVLTEIELSQGIENVFFVPETRRKDFKTRGWLE